MPRRNCPALSSLALNHALSRILSARDERRHSVAAPHGTRLAGASSVKTSFSLRDLASNRYDKPFNPTSQPTCRRNEDVIHFATVDLDRALALGIGAGKPEFWKGT